MYFKGTLEGITIDELKQNKKDKEKKLLSERLDVLESKYKKVGKFYEAFTSDIYNPNLKDGDALSHTIHVFKYLQYDANFLLTSEDVLREKNIDKALDEYDQTLKNIATKKHYNFEIAMSKTSEGNNTQYINTETTITVDDLNNEKYGQYLQSYNVARDILITEMLALQNRIDIEKEKNNEIELKKFTHSLNQIIALLSDINEDMKIIKEAFQGLTKYVIKDKKTGYIGELSTLSENIDYTNPKHISTILKYVNLNQGIEPNKEITLIAYDIKKIKEKLYEEGTLNDNDLLLISLIQSSDLTFEEIAKKLSISRKSVYNRFNAIVNKICFYHKSKEGR